MEATTSDTDAVVVYPTDALRELLDHTAWDESLPPEARRRELDVLRRELMALVGQANELDGMLARGQQAKVLTDHTALMRARANADTREALIADQRATPDEMDRLGYRSHEELNRLAAEGGLAEALAEVPEPAYDHLGRSAYGGPDLVAGQADQRRADEIMESLVDHARSELQRAGLFDTDSDYEGELGKAILGTVKAFSDYGHSGASAGMATAALEKLLRFEPLTPITSDPDEWLDRSAESGRPLWQSKRDPRAFSEDGGKTWDIMEAAVVAMRLEEARRTTAMVALYPPPEMASELALSGDGEEPADLHLTLGFMGETAGKDQEAALSAVRSWAQACPPLSGQITGVGRFAATPNSDGKPVTVLLVSLPELPAQREALVNALDDAGAPVKRDFGYIPHITLAYGARQPKVDKPIPVTFDRVTLAWNDERASVPLEGDELSEAVRLTGGGKWQWRNRLGRWINMPDRQAAERAAAAEPAPEVEPRSGEAASPELGHVRTPLVDEVLGDAQDTLDKYSVADKDGTRRYSPERRAQHRRWITDALAGHAEGLDNPEILFTGGGPASGKTSVLKQTNEDGTPTVAQPDDPVHLDQDIFKAKMDEYQRLATADPPDAYASDAVHREAADLYRAALREAQRRRMNVIAEGTGDSGEGQYAAKLRAAKDAGYHVSVVYASAPTAVAIERAEYRAKQEGRAVPLAGLRAMHANVSKRFADVLANLDAVDSLTLWDTRGKAWEGEPPVLMAELPGPKGGGRARPAVPALTVRERKLYDEFLAKADEDPGALISLPSFV